MSWDYRVIRIDDGENGDSTFEIHACFYAEDGETVISVSKDPAQAWGESPEELRASANYIMKAFTKPDLVMCILEKMWEDDGS